MKKTTLLFMLLTVSIYVGAQNSKKINQWQFPTSCGLDFNSGSPVFVTGGQVNTTEGSSSMADNNGALLLYSDGATVWDKNHNAMPNGTGLLGASSSSQAALIVQQPGNANTYFVFTVDQEAGPDGFRYSIVDMTLNGGLGNVTTKNVLLVTPVSEKVTGCRHANGQDIWIVTHKYNSAEFYAYLLTSAGLVLTPVITTVGTVHTGFGNTNSIGYMKISPDGNKLAVAISRSNMFELFDFDNATGIPSNAIPLVVPNLTYGVEFSPNSKVLYGTEFVNPIYQYDLDAGSPAAIQASQLLVATSSSPELGALQLAPDGKIYSARKTLPWLGIIQNPDVVGLGCAYIDNGFSLGGNTCYYGLPNMLPSYFNSVGFQNTCFGDQTLFTVADSGAYVICSWNFDDPSSGLLNSSQYYEVGHVFTAPGTYNVQVILVNQSAVTDTLYLPLTINVAPSVSLGNDTTVCIGSTFVIDASASGASSYTWQNGNTNSSISVNTSGAYYVVASDNGCDGTDTINVTFSPCAAPVVQFSSSDSSWCEKQSVDFFDISTNNPTTWSWTFAGASPSTSTDQNPAGIYYPSYGSFDVTLVACNAAGCDSVTISNFVTEHQNPPAPTVSISNDTLYCSSAVSYAWFNTNNTSLVLSTNAYYFPTQFGSYYVTITDSNGCSTPSSTVIVNSIVDVFGNAIYLNCHQNDLTGNSYIVSTNLENYTLSIYDVNAKLVYVSSNNISQRSEINTSGLVDGIYFVTASNAHSILTQKIAINKK